MPAAECFIDSNVLLYAVSTLPAESGKAAVARQLIGSRTWGWSAQVAAEFIHVSTSPKRSLRLSLQEAQTWIVTWLAYPMAATDAHTVLEALRVAERFQLAYFDAQIIAAAKQLGCPTVYSEDLNDGQNYGGVTVINPFRP
jgi:predicted nucleic acid-binding protein